MWMCRGEIIKNNAKPQTSLKIVESLSHTTSGLGASLQLSEFYCFKCFATTSNSLVTNRSQGNLEEAVIIVSAPGKTTTPVIQAAHILSWLLGILICVINQTYNQRRLELHFIFLDQNYYFKFQKLRLLLSYRSFLDLSPSKIWQMNEDLK